MTKLASGLVTSCLIFAFALTAASAQSPGPTLQKIKEAGTITIGHRDSSVPFSYLDDSQKPIGFSLELCGLVVAKIKAKLGLADLKMAYQAVNSSNRIPLVKNGTVDIECGSTANTIARQQEVAYSVIFYAPQFKWISLKSAGVKSTDDLKGKTVVVTQGTNTAQFVAKLNTEKGLGMKILQGKDHAESFLLVETGRATAFMEDDILLAGLKANARIARQFRLPERCVSERSLRRHDVEGRPRVQTSGRRRADGSDEVGPLRQALHQMVREPDPAKEHQPEFPAIGQAQGTDQDPERQGQWPVRGWIMTEFNFVGS